MDNKVLGILEQCEQLHEFQKKQIATILMASTLESLSLSQVIKVLVDDMANKLDSLHNELIELIAESDDSLLEAFFDKGELSEDELRGGLHSAISGGNLIPVFCVSGKKNIGVKRLMDVISKYSPCAGDIQKIKCINSSKEEMEHGATIKDSLCSYVFKTVSEQHVGELSFFRVFSGQVKSGDDVHNVTRNQSEKMRQVYYLSSRKKNCHHWRHRIWRRNEKRYFFDYAPVSYTHLTLPTSDLV